MCVVITFSGQHLRLFFDSYQIRLSIRGGVKVGTTVHVRILGVRLYEGESAIVWKMNKAIVSRFTLDRSGHRWFTRIYYCVHQGTNATSRNNAHDWDTPLDEGKRLQPPRRCAPYRLCGANTRSCPIPQEGFKRWCHTYRAG